MTTHQASHLLSLAFSLVPEGSDFEFYQTGNILDHLFNGTVRPIILLINGKTVYLDLRMPVAIPKEADQQSGPYWENFMKLAGVKPTDCVPAYWVDQFGLRRVFRARASFCFSAWDGYWSNTRLASYVWECFPEAHACAFICEPGKGPVIEVQKPCPVTYKGHTTEQTGVPEFGWALKTEMPAPAPALQLSPRLHSIAEDLKQVMSDLQ